MVDERTMSIMTLSENGKVWSESVGSHLQSVKSRSNPRLCETDFKFLLKMC